MPLFSNFNLNQKYYLCVVKTTKVYHNILYTNYMIKCNVFGKVYLFIRLIKPNVFLINL